MGRLEADRSDRCRLRLRDSFGVIVKLNMLLSEDMIPLG